MYDPNRPRLNSGGQAKPGMNGVSAPSTPSTPSSPKYTPSAMPSAGSYGSTPGGYNPGGYKPAGRPY